MLRGKKHYLKIMSEIFIQNYIFFFLREKYKLQIKNPTHTRVYSYKIQKTTNKIYE